MARPMARPMPKMRYSEMPRDVSCDSLATLRIAQGYEEKGVFDENLSSPRGNKSLPGTPVRSASVGNGHPRKAYHRTPTTTTTQSIHHHVNYPHRDQDPHRDHQDGRLGLPDNRQEAKRNSGGGYDNYGSMAHHNKSLSLPSNACASLRLDGVVLDGVILDALRVSPDDLATQLTLLDLPPFRGIHPDELISCGWNKKNKLVVAPNVVALTRRFNHVSFWTVSEVLSGHTPKLRSELLAHFIRVAKKLYDLNNLHSLFAVISGLQSAAVYRLKRTWSHLSKKDKQLFDKLAELFSDQNNWQALREHMENTKVPCIPYLGLFLTDLVYIDMAHPHSGGLESEQRRLKMNNILRIISDLQQSQYHNLQLLPHVQNYLKSVRYIEELQKFVEDDQFKLSMKLEPPSPATSISSSKESVSEAAATVASLSLSPAKAKGAAAASAAGAGAGVGVGAGARAGCSGSLRLHAAVNASSKFVPGHRKCRSLGTNIFHKASHMLACTETSPASQLASRGVQPPTPRHLLDDSVLEENGFVPPTPELPHSIPGPPVSPAKHRHEDGVKLLTMCGGAEAEEMGEVCVVQGCLRRKTVLKDGRKPAVAAWQRYWVQLWPASLIYYPPKSFKGTDRCDFKHEPCKMSSVVGLSVKLGDNPVQPDLFQISDPVRGNIYKFRAGSKGSALQWCRQIERMATGSDDKPLPANLMSFE